MKKLSQLPKELQNVSQAQHQMIQCCELCGGDHKNGQCVLQSMSHEEVNYMGNQGRQMDFNQGQNFNQGWRPHSSMGQAGSSNRPPPHNFHQYPTLTERTSKLEETLQQFMQVSISNHKSTEASIRNLEIQVGQLAKNLEEKSEKKFVANTEVNPREECKAITTRSGRVLEERGHERKEQERDEGSAEKRENKRDEMSEREEKEKEREDRENHREKEEEKMKAKVFEKPLPYPKVFSKKEKERQFKSFVDIFKKLEIKMSFSEALQQIPSHSKFMKELLTKKKKYIEEETIEVQGQCSAIIQKLLPPKFKDPGSFTIPCNIGKLAVGKALIDLGANINLMPLSMFEKIRDLEMKSTRMTLQLADRSIKYPYGV
ncbi:trichohyalin-like, partial [Vigna umbellata]|uniref:trichohyalin-like n=1 Tax=Vigna umbellata TaxID=87088 RepID=UPI001F5F89EF